MDGLLRAIPARLFAEWQVYYGLEPFGAERDNLHAALIAKMVYDVAVKPADRSKLDVDDFMLGAPLDRRPQTPEELYGLLRSAALGMGAQDPQTQDNPDAD